MNNINNVIEDYYDDSELEELDHVSSLIVDDEDLDDNEESEVNGKKRIIRPKRQAIINFGEKCRARFIENDGNIFFERKIQGKFEPLEGEESTDDNFKNDGYFGEIFSVIKYVLSVNVKEKLLHKKEVRDLEEIKVILRESEQEMKALANDIVKAIKNNEVFAEITEELMDK